MKAEFASKALQEAIRLAVSVTGGPQYLNLKADKKTGLYVVANGNDVTIQYLVEGSKASESGEVTVATAAIGGLIRGRADLEISASNKSEAKVELKAVKGSYKSEFTSPPHTPIKLAEASEKGKEVKFSKDVQVFLEEAVKNVGLSNVYTDDPIYLWLQSSEKGTTVACGDEYHFAHYHHAEVSLGKKSFSLPLKTLRDIQNLSGKRPYKISLQTSAIYASNDVMTVVMPLTQVEGLSLDQFETLVGKLKKPDAYAIVSKADLASALDNINAVYEPQVALEVGMKKGKLNVQFHTSSTKISESVKVEKEKWGDVSMKCDPSLLNDLLGVTNEKTVKLCVMDGSLAFFKVDSPNVVIHYGCCVL